MLFANLTEKKITLAAHNYMIPKSGDLGLGIQDRYARLYLRRCLDKASVYYVL